MDKLVVRKFEVITKTFLSTSDIAILMDCGISMATKFRSTFIKEFELDNKRRKMIPTNKFLEFYNIDPKYIRDNYKSIARKTKNEII